MNGAAAVPASHLSLSPALVTLSKGRGNAALWGLRKLYPGTIVPPVLDLEIERWFAPSHNRRPILPTLLSLRLGRAIPY